jgi:hypothetical protein
MDQAFDCKTPRAHRTAMSMTHGSLKRQNVVARTLQYRLGTRRRSLPAQQIFLQPAGNAENEQHHDEDQKN